MDGVRAFGLRVEFDDDGGATVCVVLFSAAKTPNTAPGLSYRTEGKFGQDDGTVRPGSATHRHAPRFSSRCPRRPGR